MDHSIMLKRYKDLNNLMLAVCCQQKSTWVWSCPHSLLQRSLFSLSHWSPFTNQEVNVSDSDWQTSSNTNLVTAVISNYNNKIHPPTFRTSPCLNESSSSCVALNAYCALASILTVQNTDTEWYHGSIQGKITLQEHFLFFPKLRCSKNRKHMRASLWLVR